MNIIFIIIIFPFIFNDTNYRNLDIIYYKEKLFHVILSFDHQAPLFDYFSFEKGVSVKTYKYMNV